VKLLFDENLSRRLPQLLADLFPGSTDVVGAGLGGAADRAFWEHARAEGFLLITKDEDFQRLSVLLGPPPKVVWVRLGNSTTPDVARILRFRVDQIRAIVEDTDSAFLVLG
jgi:predicted nuclease of predicted toxin-antitoxin system